MGENLARSCSQHQAEMCYVAQSYMVTSYYVPTLKGWH